MSTLKLKIGVLALQGSFIEHVKKIEEIGIECIEVRQIKDLKKVHGLIIPGGESTVISKLLKESGLFSYLKNLILKEKFPAVFIRAPLIKNVGKNVEILSKRKNGQIIMARQSNLLVSTFHPELVEDTRVHEFFAGMCEGRITN